MNQTVGRELTGASEALRVLFKDLAIGELFCCEWNGSVGRKVNVNTVHVAVTGCTHFMSDSTSVIRV